MKKLVTISIIIQLIYGVQGYSIDTVSIKYFPLNVGNIYVYKTVTVSYPPPVVTYSRATITKDSIIYGKKYFYCNNFPHSIYYWCRTDSNTGSLYRYDLGNSCHVDPYNKLIDSLAMRSGGYLCDILAITCDGESNVNIFGIPTTKLYFNLIIGQTTSWWTYAKNFGFASINNVTGIFSSSTTLIGCVINGTLYGDTSIPIGTQNISSDLPLNYTISQNYPNPFNPVTRIKFEVPLNKGGERGLSVRLIIYDILGREIVTLVNENKKPGTYEVDWDGNKYSSGVYFYKLITDEYVETKKMVLIK